MRLLNQLPGLGPEDGGESSCSSDSVVITEVSGLLPAEAKNLEEPQADPFEALPTELLEMVLAHVGLQDLLLSCSRVCVRWNQVIRNPLFLPQRKRYYRYKSRHCRSAEVEIVALCNSQGLYSPHTLLPGLIRYMAGFKESMRGLPNAIRTHPKHDAIMEVLKCTFEDTFPLCTEGATDQDPWWCAVAALVLVVADSVKDIRVLFRHADPAALSEALYCMATVLLHLQGPTRPCHRIHYRIYCTLHLTEMAWQETATDVAAGIASRAGQQSLHKLPGQEVHFTHEQMRIIHHELKPHHVVRILAFAGTGKTSTLMEYARLRPAQRFLYIVYNKSVCEISQQTFPSNVDCKTAHSLAFQSVGFRYQKKLVPKLHALDVAKLLALEERLSLRPAVCLARLVLSTVDSFMASVDPMMSLRNVPSQLPGSSEDGLAMPLHPIEREALLVISMDLWQRICDPEDQEAGMPHDGYLKLFQLQQPVLGSYDAIFVDEAQDCSPAMLSLVLSQPCAKLLVGDPHQQIYALQHAVDALSSVPSTHTFRLTQSFRFGPEIGFVASCTLKVLKWVTDKTIVGSEETGTVLGSSSGQVAILARCNATLFNMAVDIVCHGRYVDYGLSHVNGAFVGGLSSYGLQQILDIYYLKHSAGQVESLVRDPFVKKFPSFQQLQSYAVAAEDLDLRSKLAFVEVYGQEVPQYVRTLELHCNGDQRLANIVFSTAHKAKGLEFDAVFLADDFCMGHTSWALQARTAELLEEYHTLYVAITRARRSLCVSPAIRFIVVLAQEFF